MTPPLLKKTKQVAKSKPLKKVTKEKPLKKVKAEKHLVKKSSTDAPAPVKPKALVKKEVVPPPPRSGPKPVIPKGWKWLGKKDPAFRKEGLVLVTKVPDSFPSLHPRVVPGTQWRVDPKGKREPALVTTLPDKVRVAWDTCNTCSNHVTRCNCKGGIVHPRSIEWMYVIALMRKDGEDISHPMDSTGPHVTTRGILHYAGKSVSTEAPRRANRTLPVSKGHPTPSKPATGRSGRLSKPGRKGKTLQKTRKPVEQVDVTNVDLVELGAQASAGADKLVADFTKRIAKETKSKPLLKKGKR